MIPTLSEALAERGYDTLTAVQTAVTAPELANADLLVSAQTGSGKTVGFGLAIAPNVLNDEGRFDFARRPLALAVAPTRELALQVARELGWLYAKAGVRIATCIGGMDTRTEARTLDAGAHIVVGTPGRLRDHIGKGTLDLSDIRAVVLDEADEMLDLGFREDLEFMLDAAPADRRTLMFSATVPPEIETLAKTFQRDAQRIIAGAEERQHADISYQVVHVADRDEEHAIINMLLYHEAAVSMVFANTRAAVSRLAARMANRGFNVVSLSGELSQDERSHAIQALRDGRARVCVATDVAARGIDLPNLELVIHADLPQSTEALKHRSGRTGRAGRKGISALIVGDKAVRKAERILKWAEIEAEWVGAPTPEEIGTRDETRIETSPIWEGEPEDGEAAFAARLVAAHGAETVATALIRLYRASRGAPEELGAPAPRRPAVTRSSIGPTIWFRLNIGHNDRAEVRWVLPLVCRAFDIERGEIGKIRIKTDATFIEIAEVPAMEFINQKGNVGVCEENVTATRLDGVPSEAADGPARKFGAAPRMGAKPHRKGAPRGDFGDSRPPRFEKPEGERPFKRRPEAQGEAGDASRKPYRKGPPREDFGAARPPRFEKPDAVAPRDRTAEAPRERSADAGDAARKPRHKGGKPQGDYAAKPAGKPATARDGDRPAKKPYAPRDKAAAGGFKPKTGDFKGKPAGGKPTGAKPAGGKPAFKGKPARKGGADVPRRKG